MKLNKAMLILAAVGLLSSAASYAANTPATSGPQEATATLVVQSTATFNHDLQAVTGIMAGKLADGTVLANGTVSASQAIQRVKLSWLRSVNPAISGQDAQYAQLLPVGSTDPAKEAIPVMFKPVQTLSQSQSDDNAADYTLMTPAPTFNYRIINAASKVGKSDVTIRAGSYQMTVNADVLFA
ncbi:hypothetical protein NKN81_004414 [Salmonella enterica]|nr:hypothetical protein [Salmonella enterica]